VQVHVSRYLSNPHGGAAWSDVGPRVTHVLGIVVVNLRGASGKTAYWVLLLVLDVRPRVRHFTGYCCWLMWGLGQHTLPGIVVGLCASGNTLLDIVVGYVAPLATHITGYCCWFTRGLGQHTLLGIVVGYARFWATHFTGHH
jgi:hypothetical protein